MKKVILVALLLSCFTQLGFSGITIVEENDCFLKKDNEYTQGLEISYDRNYYESDGTIYKKVFYGVRSRIYTPRDITIKEDQPNERPWSGVTGIFRDVWKHDKTETYKYGIEIGVLGPDAQCEWEQTEFHRLINNKLPVGWDNQVPNQLDLQLYMIRYHPLLTVGRQDKFSARLDVPYGANLGTVYDYLTAGLSAKVGWNIPPLQFNDGIVPKSFISKPFIYAFGGADYRFMMANATLGQSWFVDMDEKYQRTIHQNVEEYQTGVSTGIKQFSVTYAVSYRTEEWVGQPGPIYWATIRLEFNQVF